MGKLLITGSLGNVGGYVAKHAIGRGLDVVVADIDGIALQKRFGDTAESVRFDFTDPTTFPNALRDVDRVFLMRPPHLGKPQALKPFLDAMRNHAGIQLICFLSLLGVEKNPIPPHHRIEKMLDKSGLPCCHIRPSFFMQNLSGVHAFEIRHFDRIAVPVANAKTSFIDAEDIGELIAHIMETPTSHQGKAYSITGPEALDYHEVARQMTEELGRPIRYVNLSPTQARSYWRDIRGIDEKYATVMSLLYMMTRLGSAKQVTEVFETIINRRPTDFQAFVRKHREVWAKTKA